MVISTKKVTVINPTKSKLREIEVTRKKYVREISELKEQLSFKTSELDDVTKSLTKKNLEYTSLNKLIDEKKKEINSLNKKLEKIEEALNKYGDISPEMIKNKFNESKKLIEEVNLLKNDITKTKEILSENKKKSDIVEALVVQKQKDLSELEREIDVKDTTLKSHNYKISELKKQSEAYKNALVNKDELFEENKQTRLVIAHNKKILENLKEKNTNLFNNNSDLKNYNLELEKIRNEFIKDNQKLEIAINDLMDKITDKQYEFESINKKIESKLNLLETRKSEISSLIMNNKQHLKSEKVANFLREIENGL